MEKKKLPSRLRFRALNDASQDEREAIIWCLLCNNINDAGKIARRHGCDYVDAMKWFELCVPPLERYDVFKKYTKNIKNK